MSEVNEVKEVSENETLNKTDDKKCFCKNGFVKKTAVIALGSFIGVYAALGLFALTHKPPVHKFQPAMEHFAPAGCHCKCHKGHHQGQFKGEKQHQGQHFRGEQKGPDALNKNIDGKKPPVQKPLEKKI